MAAHIHAELMAQYAQDAEETDEPWKLWEFFDGAVWSNLNNNPSWVICFKYRRIDPYRELKEAFAVGKTIQLLDVEGKWVDIENPEFALIPEHYRIKPEPKKVKLLAWFDGDELRKVLEGAETPGHWVRIPAEDKEIEIPA